MIQNKHNQFYLKGLHLEHPQPLATSVHDMNEKVYCVRQCMHHQACPQTCRYANCSNNATYTNILFLCLTFYFYACHYVVDLSMQLVQIGIHNQHNRSENITLLVLCRKTIQLLAYKQDVTLTFL